MTNSNEKNADNRKIIAANFRHTRKFTYKMSLRSRAEDETKEGMTILYANLRVGRILWQIAGHGGSQPVFRHTRKFTYKMSLRSRAKDETTEGMTILYTNLRVCRILADCSARRIAASFSAHTLTHT